MTALILRGATFRSLATAPVDTVIELVSREI
jgi:hypothetical protein